VLWEILKNKTLDVFGQAILAYYKGDTNCIITTETNITAPDELPVAYLFRAFDTMPKIEQKALELAKGKVLDVGAGAGSHALYLQNIRKLDVTALDASQGAITVCTLEEIKNVVCSPILDYNKTKYDTILLLMNGIGIAKRKEKIKNFLIHLKSLLHTEGQLLLDSSDINYMYDKEDLEELANYYGNLKYTISYKEFSETFDWVFIDFYSLKQIALEAGFACEKIIAGEHYDYLVKLVKIA